MDIMKQKVNLHNNIKYLDGYIMNEYQYYTNKKNTLINMLIYKNVL